MNPSTLRLAMDQLVEHFAQETGEETTESDIWEMGIDIYCIDEFTLLADDGMRDPLVWTERAGGWHSPGELTRAEFQ